MISFEENFQPAFRPAWRNVASARSGGRKPFPWPVTRIVTVGDSITDAGWTLDTESGAWAPNANRYSAWLYPLLGQRVRPLPTFNARKAGDLDAGYSGIQAAQYNFTGGDGVNPYSSAVALNGPGVVYVIHLGTNDIWSGGSAAAVINAVRTLWQQFAAAGCYCIATTILSRRNAGIAWDTGLQAQLDAVNVGLRANWRADGMRAMLDWNAIQDKDGEFGTAAELPDGLHPNSRLALKCAKTLADYVRPYIPASPQVTIPSNGDATIRSANPEMSGAVAQANGTFATGWAATGTSPTVIGSKVVDADGTVWQRLAVSQATLTGSFALYQTVPTGNLTPGTWIRVACTARFTPTGNGASSIDAHGVMWGTPTRYARAMNYDITAHVSGFGMQEAPEAIYLSEPVQVPATAISLVRLNTAIFGSGILDVRDFKLFTVPAP